MYICFLELLSSSERHCLKGPRRKQENNIKTNIKETEWEVVDWSHFAQHRNK